MRAPKLFPSKRPSHLLRKGNRKSSVCFYKRFNLEMHARTKASQYILQRGSYCSKQETHLIVQRVKALQRLNQ